MQAIEVKNLTKTYGASRGIVDVSFSVEEGEVFGFIGPNGAGKSTTIRTLLALLHPTSGSATIFGLDTRTQSTRILRDVGYLPSEVFYYDRMRVIDLLKYSASFYRKDCTKRIHELADALELDLKRRIDDLSYGNKKKVGIVQGLLHEPRLIILDEPTSGLDPLMQQTFFRLLERENERGATILFSSHILSEVQRLCDRVAIIKEGRIIELQSMATLQAQSYTKVRLEAPLPMPRDALAGLNVTNAAWDEGDRRLSFLYRGEINALLRAVAGLDLARAEIGEPDLEEIFLHYYREGREGAGA